MFEKSARQRRGLLKRAGASAALAAVFAVLAVDLTGRFWLVAVPCAVSALLDVMFFARTATDLVECHEAGIRNRALGRVREYPWAQITGIEPHRMAFVNGRTVVVRLHLASGKTTTLAAPMDGGYFKDPDFAGSIARLRECRGAASSGPGDESLADPESSAQPAPHAQQLVAAPELAGRPDRRRALVAVGILLGVGSIAVLGIRLAAGHSASPLSLPASIGTSVLVLSPDPRPITVGYPELLPPDGVSYSMVSGMYSGATGTDPAATVDGIYANAGNGAPGTLTTDPAALVTTALSSIDATGVSPYAPGTHGGALQCGIWAVSPVCVWADASTEVFVFFDGGSGASASVPGAAAITVQIRAAIEQ